MRKSQVECEKFLFALVSFCPYRIKICAFDFTMILIKIALL